MRPVTWLRLAVIAVTLAACSSSGTKPVGLGPSISAPAASSTTAAASSTTAVPTSTAAEPTSTAAEPDESSAPPAAFAQPQSQFPSPNPATCGVERQRVKTGEDADAAKVDQTRTVTSTIAAMAALPPPVQPISRAAPVEDTVYKLTGTLTGFKTETDSDYHLVLSDGQGATMIAEIPAPGCVTGGPFRAAIATSRAAFDARFRPSPTFVKVAVPVTVVGVGFFDRIHGQTGVAPNGIELHPVLSITYG